MSGFLCSLRHEEESVQRCSFRHPTSLRNTSFDPSPLRFPSPDMTWPIVCLAALLVVQLPFTPLARATLINVTVDDSYPDPRTGAVWSYVPPEGWNVGQNCSACYAQLDKTRLMNETWHDSTTLANSGDVLTYAKLDFAGAHIVQACGGGPLLIVCVYYVI